MKIVVVDDHKLFRQGLIGLMRAHDDLVEVVGEASSGQEAVQLAHQLRPDVILMDIQMPDGDGLEATRKIRQSLPDIAVVMLTASELDEHLYEAVRLGAAGYLLKDLDAAELFELLDGVTRNEVAMTRAMASRLLKIMANNDGHESGAAHELTEREIEVLHLLSQGASNPQIAEELVITVNTVKSHISHILAKLQLENRTQAAAYAVQKGIVFPE
ncbi:MAG: response regulator transcription factor [Ardenticatenaceae bacterium]|nr:response regulator transcription factor [Ardenticatenaceae bacterium]MCB9443459.1 response regulator transcription factor [Ardenticatenaceae bacterium]